MQPQRGEEPGLQHSEDTRDKARQESRYLYQKAKRIEKKNSSSKSPASLVQLIRKEISPVIKRNNV